MSDQLRLFEWRDEIRSARGLIASDRQVAIEISLFMDVNGRDARPSIATIVKNTARSKATVLDSLAWLRASGWLTWTRTSRRAANIYEPLTPLGPPTRKQRTEYMKRRRELLAASRSERRTNSPETNSVGLNGDIEWVESATHDLPELLNDPSRKVSAIVARGLDAAAKTETGQEEASS
jgi:hypothetical protein